MSAEIRVARMLNFNLVFDIRKIHILSCHSHIDREIQDDSRSVERAQDQVHVGWEEECRLDQEGEEGDRPQGRSESPGKDAKQGTYMTLVFNPKYYGQKYER
jgi:hypothetical protein